MYYCYHSKEFDWKTVLGMLKKLSTIGIKQLAAILQLRRGYRPLLLMTRRHSLKRTWLRTPGAEVLQRWREDDDGGLRVARMSEPILGRAGFAWLVEGESLDVQEMAEELKETTFLLLANGSQGNGLQGSVAWNGQENACLRGASWMNAWESSGTASGGTAKASGLNPSRSQRWHSSASCCSSSAAHPSLGWRRSSGAAATSPSGG